MFQQVDGCAAKRSFHDGCVAPTKLDTLLDRLQHSETGDTYCDTLGERAFGRAKTTHEVSKSVMQFQ